MPQQSSTRRCAGTATEWWAPSTPRSAEAARFVSAYANADPPTGEALFGAALADGQLSECLMTLAGSTIATLRQRGLGA